MGTPRTNILDHIVHLTPPGSVDQTCEQWRELGFNVVPGGTHADGLTANALVVLQDGVYVELISFTHPSAHYPADSPERRARDSHSWASKQPGWIDYAFLGTSDSLSTVINERAKREGNKVEYLPEQRGGRERPDGRALKWLITAPDPGVRGTLPFFCGDVTPRSWRVPVEPPSNAEHSSKALGIAHVRLLAEDKDIKGLSRQLTSVLGSSPIDDNVESKRSLSTWALETPSTSEQGSIRSVPTPLLILSGPKDDTERSYLLQRGSGIYEIALWVGKGGNTGDNDVDNTPYGKLIWKLS